MSETTPERIFTLRELTRLLRLTPSRQSQLRRLGLLRDAAVGYRFRDLVAARAAVALLERGATVRQVREALDGARRLAPDAQEPLSELRLHIERNRVIVEQDRHRFDPRTGQALLDFEMTELQRETKESLLTGAVRPMVPPAEAAERWFSRASDCDGDPARWEAAVEAYTQVVAIDPGYAAAWNNLGLLKHRMGQYERAGECYRKALDADESCCQAAFNLGSLHEDLDDLDSALAWYRRALVMQPDYADAHFNLAGVLAKSGQNQAAARHWRRYLELDHGSPWAQIAQSHLDGMDGPESDP
jgi:tetratricopeptide (TPR) repeat protein